MKKSIWSFLLILILDISTCTNVLFCQWIQANNPFGGNVSSLAISNTNIFAGTRNGLFVSSDNGKTWTAANNGLTDPRINALLTLDQNIFAGTASGVFHSSDNGLHWTSVNIGLPEVQVLSLIAADSNIYVGTSGRGVYFSTDYGLSWTARGLSARYISSFAISDTNLFAGTEIGVFRTSDKNSTWTLVNTGISNPWILSLATSDTNLFAGNNSGDLYQTKDHGTTWTQINENFTNNEILAIAIAGVNLYVGTNGDGVYHSPDYGQSWAQLNDGLTNNNISSLFTYRSRVGCEPTLNRNLTQMQPTPKGRIKVTSNRHLIPILNDNKPKVSK